MQFNIFDSTIHNNRIGILSEGTHFAIKDTYIFGNGEDDNTGRSVIIDGRGHRTLMIPVTGAYDRRPDKLEFVNFRSDLYSSKDGDSWSWIEEIWRYGTDPYLTTDQTVDTDGDGLSNVDEADEHGTDPLSPDTDGDGVPDGEDLHPFYDALLKVHIRQREENVMDWGLVDDLHRFSLSKITIDDTWDSGLPQRFEGNLRGNGITLFRNIDDTTDSVDIVIEDFWMNPPNLVLLGNSEFTFNVVDGTWSGETWAESVEGSMGEYSPLYIYEDPAYTAIIEVSFSIAPEINPGRQRMLAERYSPVLYFHEDEEYFPVDIGSFLSQSTLVKSGPNINSPTPDDLAEHPSSSNYLDLWSNFENEYNATVYSRVFTATDNKIVIQYWFFYFVNPAYQVPGTDWYLNYHEGDWEMIQLILPDKNSAPTQAGYSWHY